MDHNKLHLNFLSIISILGIAMVGFFLFSAMSFAQTYVAVDSKHSWSASNVANLKRDIDTKYTNCGAPIPATWTLLDGNDILDPAEVAPGKIIRAEHLYRLQRALVDLVNQECPGTCSLSFTNNLTTYPVNYLGYIHHAVSYNDLNQVNTNLTNITCGYQCQNLAMNASACAIPPNIKPTNPTTQYTLVSDQGDASKCTAAKCQSFCDTGYALQCCTPTNTCTGFTCGFDSCGVSCGPTCPPGQECKSLTDGPGTCCTPQFPCGTNNCGADDCGRSCGTCTGPASCEITAPSTSGVCCTSRVATCPLNAPCGLGSDSCGGYCTCGSGQSCVNSLCVTVPNTCNNGTCDPGESFTNCPADCPSCGTCPNGSACVITSDVTSDASHPIIATSCTCDPSAVPDTCLTSPITNLHPGAVSFGCGTTDSSNPAGECLWVMS
jgi:hypothetical protein